MGMEWWSGSSITLNIGPVFWDNELAWKTPTLANPTCQKRLPGRFFSLFFMSQLLGCKLEDSSKFWKLGSSWFLQNTPWQNNLRKPFLVESHTLYYETSQLWTAKLQRSEESSQHASSPQDGNSLKDDPTSNFESLVFLCPLSLPFSHFQGRVWTDPFNIFFLLVELKQ